jgi:hypothetical protein
MTFSWQIFLWDDRPLLSLTRAPHDAGRASSPAPGDDSRGPKTRELGSPSGVTDATEQELAKANAWARGDDAA